MKYIAYGSNMSTQQMAHRCPDARLIGTGHIHGARLEFYMHATLVHAGNGAPAVPVAAWEISAADEQQLDRYEGFPNYYRKSTCTVDMIEGSQIKGMIYLMHKYRFSPPTREYFEGIREAYEELGLHSEIKKVLLPALMRSHRFAKD